MLFNSLEFIIFLVATVALFALSPKRFRRHILLAASLFFYASWNVIYLVLIGFVVAVSYIAGLLIESRGHGARRVLSASIVCSLGVLGLFKYGNFFIDNLNIVLGAMDRDLAMGQLGFLLPVGISFYTFQAVAYTVDVYKNRIPAEHNFVDYAVYITFFPQLVAGPIERAGNILPQVKDRLECLPENIVPAFTLILSGFFKKLVIADRLSVFVDTVYTNPGAHSGAHMTLAFYFFAFQIYCDFSGYTDIARGVARLFNVQLMENFNRPYFATSVQDFWRRWHISLSTWFRDYLYIPLGGSRNGRSRTLANIMIVFALCGLWHGAAYTFVVWGILHGLMLVGEHLYDRVASTRSGRLSIPRVVKVLVTFHVVSILWVFFRARTMPDAVTVLEGLARLPDMQALGALIFTEYENLLGVIFILVLLLFEKLPLADIFRNPVIHRPAEVLFQMICLLLILAFGIFDTTTFIYFQF